jgi:hypothetical protein
VKNFAAAVSESPKRCMLKIVSNYREAKQNSSSGNEGKKSEFSVKIFRLRQRNTRVERGFNFMNHTLLF